jgi:hypothetical protein
MVRQCPTVTSDHTLMNIEFKHSRNAFEAAELFSMACGAWWVRWISKVVDELGSLTK